MASPRILVVEDESHARAVLSVVLAQAGFETEFSTNGAEAIRVLEERSNGSAPVDLILTDVRMAGGDGLTLLAKSKELHPTLPVLLMTAYGEREVLREALELGCDGYIDKPFEPEDVIALLEKTIARESNRRSLDHEQRRSQEASFANSGRLLPVRGDRIGKYEISQMLATGGMGIIYLARQLDLDRLVVLKVLREQLQPAAAARIRNEARAMAQLRHPNIAVVHEIGSHQGLEYLAMEFIEGVTLSQRIRDSPFTPVAAVRALLPVAEGLALAHMHGILHRDLKPTNIMIDRSNRPVLLDFGISIRSGDIDDVDGHYILGTLPYMALEYARGCRYDERCEIYALGVVLYEALAGKGKTPRWDRHPDVDYGLSPYAQLARRPYTPISQRMPDLDPALAAIVDAATARREDRIRTLRSLLRTLSGWLVEQPN